MKMISRPQPRDPARAVNPLIETNCPCTRDCPRHGNCFECLANHRDCVTSTPPACVRDLYEAKKESDPE